MKISQQDQQLRLKFNVLGDSGVGKRAFVQFLKTGKFIDTSTYISIDPGAPIESIECEVGGKNALIFLFWNNWPHNKPPIPAIREAFYKGTDGIIFLYDITRQQTFEHLQDFIVDAAKNLPHNPVPTLLLGNKRDEEEKRQVSIEEGETLAKKVDGVCSFAEISCKTGSGVRALIEGLARRCIKS